LAISYGYKGEAPKHLNWFCTDEDQGSDKATLVVKSAECTKSDATSDPYSFGTARLQWCCYSFFINGIKLFLRAIKQGS